MTPAPSGFSRPAWRARRDWRGRNAMTPALRIAPPSRPLARSRLAVLPVVPLPGVSAPPGRLLPRRLLPARPSPSPAALPSRPLVRSRPAVLPVVPLPGVSAPPGRLLPRRLRPVRPSPPPASPSRPAVSSPGPPSRRPARALRLARTTVFALVLAFCPAWVSADSLAESWSDLLTYERPPAPPRAEATLRGAWEGMLAGYPADAIRTSPDTLEAARRIPEAYRRDHRFYGHGPEDWARRLAPYQPWVEEAARRFGIPPAIIRAVILQESGGDASARAKGTSAKGLMQTIDATFALAKEALAGAGLRIRDPLTPRDSILAGSWYLAYCFDLAARDHGVAPDRKDPHAWRRALEYYYAGPGWGRDPRPIIHVYRKGKRTRIHKGRYSDGVLAYVDALGTGTLPAGT